MITSDLIDKIAPYLMAASDELEEAGDSDCEVLRQAAQSYEEPEWIPEFRNGFHREWGFWLQLSGSRLIAPGSCSKKSDWDFFAIMSPEWEATQDHWGWRHTSDYPDSPFQCYRGTFTGEEDINLILFSDSLEGSVYCGRYAIATKMCRQLRVTSKPMRCALFQTIMYGSTYNLAKELEIPWVK